MQQKEVTEADLGHYQESKPIIRQDPDKNKSSSGLSNSQTVVSILDQQLSPIDDDTSLSSNLPLGPPPVCRQFWKAGNYEEELVSKPKIQNGKGYLHIHPRFLHSNATSHKWAFGAVAELLDNAIDEIQNGATFVLVDKTLNPRDGCPALLIQDDGGGMDPEAMRRCLSFGFSDKKSKSAIGQYGNGFKTSSMRLGADVIVFSRYYEERKVTQSIGLLSYTFLTQAGYDRIVVPMVDYQLNASNGKFETMDQYGKEHSESNLSMLLQWSPYSTEAELLQQFNDIGYHGTKVIIYNLWINEKGTLELDFESDAEDIRLGEDAKAREKANKKSTISDQHLANRLCYSLREYLSVLYLRLPGSFKIILRGRVVEYHNIAADLKFPEFILYKPQSAGCLEGTVLTTIGFLKEAPHVNVHGFNVYHKNRLILPFWHVVSFNDSRGRGVVGVLEANFIEPTHNKQDFEKTSVFQKLVNRLKEMTWEYWDYHCGLIGYQVKKKLPAPTPSMGSAGNKFTNFPQQPVVPSNGSSKAAPARAVPDGVAARRFSAAASSTQFGRAVPVNLQPKVEKDTQQGHSIKRKEQHLADPERLKRRAMVGVSTEPRWKMQPVRSCGTELAAQVDADLMQENKKLKAQCLEYEKREKVLNDKVEQLRSELEAVRKEFAQMMTEVDFLENVKQENSAIT